jgi:Pyruvate dehydrogenase complex, dehydrogenase (E1) component
LANLVLKSGAFAMPIEPARLELLSALARKVLWLSSWTIHHANHIRPNADGLKVGGHQASSASLANIMSALYFSVLRRRTASR